MTTFTSDDRLEVDNSRPRCGCGKSIHQPYCDGSHARTDQQLKEWHDKIELERYRRDAMGLWFDGGSCTGGKPE
jgi:CDGSH-type Zn-finger protein